ncbi:MAG: CHAT domain-containing protein, partial [Acidobacteriota bacterium]|nr:CHAT domain-containing protein [Acidobacteriota bacterium]
LYAERSKGRVLLDVLTNGGRVNVTKAMSVRETAEEQRLNRTIVGLNDRIRSENLKPAPEAGLLKNLEVRLNSARIEYEHFQNVLYTTHPELRIQRGHTPALMLDTIASFVTHKETAFLEYVVTKESAFLFVITKEDQVGNLNLRMYPLNVKGSDLVKKASRFRQLMADRHPIFSALSLELYDLLIKPAEAQLQGKRTLCIIPDGALWHVSFQALQSKAGQFLLEDYAVYYTSSLGVLREMAKPGSGSAKDARPSLIAFGNPIAGKEWVAGLRGANRGKNFDPLPEAEVEVMALEEMFGRANSKVFIGAKANEPNFKSLAPAYDTIHLATHGVLDDRHPLYSYLLLAKADGEVVKEDGLLEAREIINMNIGADLVVLSACETARGRVGAGEGIIGMSWAFFIAGSRTTVVSQWKVSSASTSKLMVNFYRHLKSAPSREGRTKATALRLAALELMKDERYRHPFYWAGFVMIGSNE